MQYYIVFALVILLMLGLHWKLRELRYDRWITWLIYGTPAFLIVVMNLYFGMSDSYIKAWDFINGYYSAGVMVFNGASSELYSRETPTAVGGYVNIPIFALLFLPFAALTKIQAFIVFSFLGLSAILLAGHFLSKGCTYQQKLSITLLFMVSGPLPYSLTLGNVTHFLLLPLLAIFYWSQTRRDFGMGAILAVSVLTKPFLLLFGIYFVARKRWKVLVGLVMTLAVIFGLSLYLFGIGLHVEWLEHLNQLGSKPLSGYNNQSPNGFLARLLLNPDLSLWSAQEVNWQFGIARHALLGLLVGLVTVVFLRAGAPRTPEEQNLELSIILCLAIIIAPISWSHYYLLLLIPYSLYITDRLAIPKKGTWFNLMLFSMVLTSAPVISPMRMAHHPILKYWYSKVFISHYFFGGILLLGILLAGRTAKDSQADFDCGTSKCQS